MTARDAAGGRSVAIPAVRRGKVSSAYTSAKGASNARKGVATIATAVLSMHVKKLVRNARTAAGRVACRKRRTAEKAKTAERVTHAYGTV